MLYLGSVFVGVGGGAVYATLSASRLNGFPIGAALRLASPRRVMVRVRL
jgi:hypothetical protein